MNCTLLSMPFQGKPIHLTAAQRTDLEEVARARAFPADFVQRAKVVLLLAGGVSARTVASTLDISRPTIAKWRRRFLDDGIEGLASRYRGRAPWRFTAQIRARVLAATRRRPPDGTTHLVVLAPRRAQDHRPADPALRLHDPRGVASGQVHRCTVWFAGSLGLEQLQCGRAMGWCAPRQPSFDLDLAGPRWLGFSPARRLRYWSISCGRVYRY